MFQAMLDLLRDMPPGRFFLLATFLPLAASAFLFVFAMVRSMIRQPGTAPAKIPDWGAYLVLFAMAAAAVFSVSGTFKLHNDVAKPNQSITEHDEIQRPILIEELYRKNWSEQWDWIQLGSQKSSPVISLGYRIDYLSALMISMVTVVGTLIVLFSIGYMNDERTPTVDDHAIHHHRRGRFGRFFAYLGLFAFSMLNLLVADNLLQVFISWELVGVCSFFLIGFYSERKTASTAANKAFIVNRIGDAGFLIALFIAWTQFRTFNIASLIDLFSHADVNSNGTTILFGLGLFLGCVGKSAQMPLQTWLPDAMEGPTPVSALIHAATMVAAGVYLVGRCFPLFVPDVLQVIAFTGAITAFVSATIAVVQNDIKRVLAFSTCSQLGFMMLALGIGAWTAALLHLMTHAFFKALLFLGSGSVIHACHHEQDLRKMGGLREKLPITAYTMLIGVMAISGVPFLSGWYSKDQIMSAVIGNASIQGKFGLVNAQALLYVLPVITVALTAFYMTRLWLMAFAGKPRDHHIHDHAHESPTVMTLPLIVLAIFSVGIAWGWPIWDAEKSYLGMLIHRAQPLKVTEEFDSLAHAAEHNHLLAGGVSLLLAGFGAGIAISMHRRGAFLRENNNKPLRKFLDHRWYFDELYSFLFVRTTKEAALAATQLDKSKIDVGSANTKYDVTSLDGWLASTATFASSAGNGIHRANSGKPRTYVFVLALTATVLLGILSIVIRY